MKGGSSPWRDVTRIWNERRWRCLLGLALLLINRAAACVPPWSTRYFLDDVVVAGHWAHLIQVSSAVAGAALIESATSFLNGQILGVEAQAMIVAMRRQLVSHVIRLPVRHLEYEKTGSLTYSIMADTEAVKSLLGMECVQIIGSVMTLAIAVTVLFSLSSKLTTALLLLMASAACVAMWASRWVRRAFVERATLNAEVAGRLGEALAGVRTVKAYAAEHVEAAVFADGMDRLLRSTRRLLTGISGMAAYSSIVGGACGVLILLMGGRAVRTGVMTAGMLLQYMSFTMMAFRPAVQAGTLLTQMSEALAALERLARLRRTPTEEQEDEHRSQLGDVKGDVEFDNVTFEYVAGTPVLNNVSFVARAGMTTAIVGASGAGKTTVMRLLMGVDRPESGRVLLDGRDLEGVRKRDIRRNVAVVLQDTFLFEGTIEENIAYGRPSATRDEVVSVAVEAHCHDFIQRLELGYDTLVGERGLRLSAGQRQRIAIARALLVKSRLLILDEATSSLDSDSESSLLSTLRGCTQRTTFVIAHRLSTVRDADQILVLEKGSVIECGPHDELMARRGTYRRLYDRQAPGSSNACVETVRA